MMESNDDTAPDSTSDPGTKISGSDNLVNIMLDLHWLLEDGIDKGVTYHRDRLTTLVMRGWGR